MIIKPQAPASTTDSAAEPTPRPPKVKDMSPDDTPRERAEQHGCHILSIPDLWALILRTGTVGNPITQLCRDLMAANEGRLRLLERRTRPELLAIKGLGPLKALQIEAVLELIRRYNSERPLDNPIIRSSIDLNALLAPRLGHLDHEQIWAVLLNRRHQAIKLVQLTRGHWTATIFDVKILIKEALLENATALVLAHNHPSGNLTPSPQDDNITRRAKEACQLMDITLLDHLIITSHAYYSYADQSRL